MVVLIDLSLLLRISVPKWLESIVIYLSWILLILFSIKPNSLPIQGDGPSGLNLERRIYVSKWWKSIDICWIVLTFHWDVLLENKPFMLNCASQISQLGTFSRAVLPRMRKSGVETYNTHLSISADVLIEVWYRTQVRQLSKEEKSVRLLHYTTNWNFLEDSGMWMHY